MDKKIRLYNCELDEQDDTGIFAMGFVDLPANAQKFVALKNALKLKLDKHKHILTGAVLIPGQRIYRNDEKYGEYFITFDAPTIERIAAKMLKTDLALSTTTHNHEDALKGNHLAEIWLVADPVKDKSNAIGAGQYPAGTLMASYKVTDANYWRDEVLTGNVTGFSLEGIFNYNLINMKKVVKKATALAAKPKLTAFGAMLVKMGVPVLLEDDTKAAAEDLVDEAAKDEVDAGDPFLVFELSEGGEIMVDADGFATLDNEQMPAGEHELSDGNFIVIDDEGNLVVTQDEADAVTPEVAAEALKAAKKRGAAFLKAAGSKQSQITALKAKIAKLEKAPSAGKAKPSVLSLKETKDLSHTEKMALSLSARLERKGK